MHAINDKGNKGRNKEKQVNMGQIDKKEESPRDPRFLPWIIGEIVAARLILEKKHTGKRGTRWGI